MLDTLILSIAIPTYNRSKSLNMLLQSICQQIDNNTQNKLEVLIFDNCSEDDTETIAKKFTASHHYIRYVRNKTNIGSDNNFTKAFWSARGRYLWMIGDDELLFDNAIPWIINHCETTVFGCAYLYSIPDSLDKIHQFLHHPIPANIKTTAYTPWNFAQAVNYRLTFLSAALINRDAVLTFNPNIAEDIHHFVGSNLVHLTWVLTAIRSSPQSVMITTPLFASTIANSSGYNPVKIFIVNLSILFGYYFTAIKPSAQKFIQWFTLIGWFPKVIYDVRFTDKYKNTSYQVTLADFPTDMQQGLSWMLFNKGVLHGSRWLAFAAMITLKLCHKTIQKWLTIRSIR